MITSNSNQILALPSSLDGNGLGKPAIAFTGNQDTGIFQNASTPTAVALMSSGYPMLTVTTSGISFGNTNVDAAQVGTFADIITGFQALSDKYAAGAALIAGII